MDIHPTVDETARAQLHERVKADVQHYPPSTTAGLAHAQLRREYERLAHLVVQIVPPGRELSMALTKLLDESMAHANAGVARHHERLTAPDFQDGLEWTYEQ